MQFVSCWCSRSLSRCPRADPARDALAEVARCADIADAAERLKCFDAAMARVKMRSLARARAPTSLLEWFGSRVRRRP
jgi:hypothetical protein